MNIENAININTLKLNIDGWITVNIKYGFYRHNNENYLLWQVIGTSHTFRCSLKIITTNHGHDYKEHFRLTLLNLKKDLKEWYQLGLPEDWMKNYYNQFFKFLDSPFE